MENCDVNRSEAIALGVKEHAPDWTKSRTNSINPIPYYANKTVDLYYPIKPNEGSGCLATENPDIVDKMIKHDWKESMKSVDLRKNEVLSKIQSLDDKLNSKEYSFLQRFQPVAPCSCSHSTSSACPCPARKLPMKFDLTSNWNQDSGLKCVCNCPIPTCKCGSNCPSRPGPLEALPERTFHVPGCPSDRSFIPTPKSSIPGSKVCPFSPACCPIGDTCPFPVEAIYDPQAPALLPFDRPRKCPRRQTQGNACGKPSKCCPLSTTCGGDASQSLSNMLKEMDKRNCPLLSCSLGPLLAHLFEDEECPFCHEKTCPLVSPDVGCIGAKFCPQSILAICSLRNSPEAMKSAESKDEIQLKVVDETAQSARCFCSNQPKVCMFSQPPVASSQLPTVRETIQLNSEEKAKPGGHVVVPNGDGASILFDCPFLRIEKPTPLKNGSTEQTAELNGASLDEKLSKKPSFPDEPNVHGKDNIISTKRSSKSSSSPKKREFKSNSIVKSSLEEQKRPSLANANLLQKASHGNSCPVNTPVSPNRKTHKELALKGGPKSNCPVKTAPCEMFPEGRCPMENINLCECQYPLLPCMERLVPERDAIAEPQYCYKMDCCMGLPLPPTKPSEEFETETWYKLCDVKPGQSVTKHYLDPSPFPPEPEFLVSVNKKRAHPSWNIVKYGEGYMKCKRIKELINARGSMSTMATQFDQDDLPSDEEIAFIEKCRNEEAKQLAALERKLEMETDVTKSTG